MKSLCLISAFSAFLLYGCSNGDSSDTVINSPDGRINDTYNLSIVNVSVDPIEIPEPTELGGYTYQRTWASGTEYIFNGVFDIKNVGKSSFNGTVLAHFTSDGAYIPIQVIEMSVKLSPGESKHVVFSRSTNLPGTIINIEDIPNEHFLRIQITSDDNSVYTGGPMRFDTDVDDNINFNNYFYIMSSGS